MASLHLSPVACCFLFPVVFRFKAIIVEIDEDLASLTAKKEESKARIEKGVVRALLDQVSPLWTVVFYFFIVFALVTAVGFDGFVSSYFFFVFCFSWFQFATVLFLPFPNLALS